MKPKGQPSDHNRAPSPGGADMMGAGVQLAVSIVVFLYAGRWLDARLGTEPLMLLLGVFVGFGASFYSIYRRLVPPSDRGRRRPPEER